MLESVTWQWFFQNRSEIKPSDWEVCSGSRIFHFPWQLTRAGWGNAVGPTPGTRPSQWDCPRSGCARLQAGLWGTAGFGFGVRSQPPSVRGLRCSSSPAFASWCSPGLTLLQKNIYLCITSWSLFAANQNYMRSISTPQGTASQAEQLYSSPPNYCGRLRVQGGLAQPLCTLVRVMCAGSGPSWTQPRPLGCCSTTLASTRWGGRPSVFPGNYRRVLWNLHSTASR